jgi:hypothetical protein
MANLFTKKILIYLLEFIYGHARIKFMGQGERAVPKDTLRTCPFNWHARIKFMGRVNVQCPKIH